MSAKSGNISQNRHKVTASAKIGINVLNAYLILTISAVSLTDVAAKLSYDKPGDVCTIVQ
jgi:hypothetical protein